MVKAREILKKIFVGFNSGFVLIIILSFILGWQLGHKDYTVKLENYKPKISISNQAPPDKTYNIDFKLFWETWNMVSQKYIDKQALDPQKLYYGAIQGMVAAIGDPYTVFLPPSAQKTTKEQLGGSFEGVGIQLGYNKDKRLVVVAPLKDTPADHAGVKAGDLILEINKKDTANLSLPEAVNLIRGPKGTTVNLALYRENEPKPFDVELTRDTIVVKSISFEEKTTKSGKKIAYLRVSTFGEKTKEEWDQAVSDTLASAPQGVIVDVRNNPGGFLEAAVYLASEFLDKGTIVIQENAKGEKQEQGILKQGKLLKLPLVVLINKGSASASEILAGAIQDHQRGTLVGEQSFGKGTIQSAEDLAEGTGIHITTAKWLTPNGRWIHNTGLTPDVKVEIDTSQKVEKNPPAGGLVDQQLEKALEVLDK